MRTTIELEMNGKKVGADLRKYLKSLSYREALDGEADTLEVTLHDIEGLFMADWFPERGMSLGASLSTEYERTDLGNFYIDEIENSYPPSECKIKATSIPPDSTAKAAEKWRSWENATLSTIAGDVASNAGLSLFYGASYNPTLDRVEQSDESDLKFLHRLCNDNGLALKLNDERLIIFDIEEYEGASSTDSFTKGEARIKRFSMRSTLNEIYSDCQVNYDSGNEKIPYSGLIGGALGSLTSKKGGGKTLKINKRVRSVGDARRLAQKKLKEKNRKETTLQLTVVGSLGLRAGATFELKEFHAFNGKYLIQKATHSVNGSGYVTSIEATKC